MSGTSSSIVGRPTPRQIVLRAVSAAGLLVAATFLLSGLFATQAPFALLADRVISATPSGVYAALLRTLQFWGKPFLLVSLASFWFVLAFLVAVVAQLLALRGAGKTQRGYRPIVGAGIVVLILSTVVTPWAAGNGPLAVDAATSAWRFVAASAGAALAFGLVLFAMTTPPDAASPSDPQMRKRLQRRDFLKWAGVSIVVVGGATMLSRNVGGLLSSAGPSKRALSLQGTATPEITPTEDFYVISKNFSDPRVDGEKWRLVVDGIVERPVSLTYDELKALGASRQITTLECISNEVGGPLMSNASWTGVALTSLLSYVGAQPEARYLISYAADDYHESLPIDVARGEGVMLAYEMNGEPLTHKHGFPSRLLIPGRYGMKNTKWVERLELSPENKLGYWENRGWDEPAIVKTMSRIDVPANRAALPLGPTTIGGVAYAGVRGISGVQVSTDGGETWSDARVREALARGTWQLWTLTWEPPATGSYRLLVRAIDGNGDLQTDKVDDPFPDGASGYHSVGVRIV